MEKFRKAWLSAILLLFIGTLVESDQSAAKPRNNIFVDFQDISGDGRYMASWAVNFNTNVITFEVKVATLGYVGLGITTNGRMEGADIFIGGVSSTGTPYHSDRFGVGQSLPVVDDSQDWNLISATQDATHTSLKFSRRLDTCDKVQDNLITPDTLKLIWSIGKSDTLEHHGQENRGVYSVNLLDPPMPPVDTSKFDKWSLERTMVMPKAKTSYWCTMHRSPPGYTSTRHVVGFNTRLDGPDSLAHTHHLNVYKCTAPPGMDPKELFEPHVGTPGNECYGVVQDIPSDYCRTMIYVWAVGGKPMFFPENVGFPITEDGEVDYLMYEIHYNNPTEREGVSFTSSVEMFSTQEIREQDAAVLIVSHSISFSHLIPPKAQDFVTISHCGPECTGRKINPNGIKLINVMLHSHLLGRKMKLRHFRGREELPWVAVDDNYDFDYQQNRPLREPVLVMPRDQLTIECTTDSSANDGITLGGLSTTAEMCQSIIWYFPRGDLRFCESAYPEWKTMNLFGIENITWDNILEPPIVTEPIEWLNQKFDEVVNRETQWTPEMIRQYQREIRLTKHYEVSCGITPIPETQKREVLQREAKEDIIFIGYPDVDEEYQPIDLCSIEETSLAPEETSVNPGETSVNPGETSVNPGNGGDCREDTDCDDENEECVGEMCRCKEFYYPVNGMCESGSQAIIASSLLVLLCYIAVFKSWIN